MDLIYLWQSYVLLFKTSGKADILYNNGVVFLFYIFCQAIVICIYK